LLELSGVICSTPDKQRKNMHMPQSYWKEEKREHEKLPKKKVIKHLKGDIKTFKHEAHEDRELIHDLHKKHTVKKHNLGIKKHHSKVSKVMKGATEKSPKVKHFIEKRMHEFKEGEMHSRVKKTGPVVSNPKQAIAIALNESRKKGARIPKKHK
jgi:hypothetical protein